jgi:uncharacterized protein DUF6627
MTARLRRFIATVLAICIAAPLPSQAAMVATNAALAGSQRTQVARLLERADVQARLEAYGVSAAGVKARVAALSDDEAAALAAKIDSLPAGGDLVTAVVLVFLILLLTDILGYTKIFPFTRPVR